MLLEQSGVTDPELRAIQARGFCTTNARNDKNWALYPETMIETLRRMAQDRPSRLGSIRRVEQEITYTANEFASCVKLLRAGNTLEDVIVETELHPTVAMVIVRDYQDVSGAMLIPRVIMEEINTLPLPGTFPIKSPPHLLEILKACARDQNDCANCKKRTRHLLCAPCLRDRTRERRRARTEPSPAPPSELTPLEADAEQPGTTDASLESSEDGP